MPGPCPQGYRPENVETNEIARKLHKLYHMAANDPMMRNMVFGGTVDGVNTWLKDNFGVNPQLKYNRLTDRIVTMALTEAQVQRDAMNRGMSGLFAEGTTPSKVMGKVVAAMFLPQEIIEANIIGGDRIFLDTMSVQQQAEGMTKRFQDTLRTVIDNVQKVMDYPLAKASRDISRIETAIQNAKSEQKRQELRELRDRMLAGKSLPGEDATTFKSYRVVRDLVLAMHGQYVNERGDIKPLKLRRVAVEQGIQQQRREAQQMLETEQELSGGRAGYRPPPVRDAYHVDAGSLTRTLEAMWIRDGVLKEGEALPSGIATMTEQLSGLYRRFASLVEQGMDAQREIMTERLLATGELGLSREEAAQLAADATKFDPRDIYFPKMMTTRMSLNQELIAELGVKNTAAVPTFQAMAAEAQKKMMASKEDFLANTLSRALDGDPRDYAMNLIGTTVKYADRVIDYWRNNRMAAIAQRHVSKMVEAAYDRNIDMGQRQQYLKYARGVEDYLEAWRDLSRGTHDGGVWDDLMRIATSTKVFLTMGLNPSSPFVNLLDGHFMTGMNANVGKATSNLKSMGFTRISPTGKKLIDDVLNTEHSDMFVQDIFLNAEEGRDARKFKEIVDDRIRMIQAKFGNNPTTKVWADIERDSLDLLSRRERAARRVKAVADATSEGATLSLVWMGMAENHLRSHAMRKGAEQEYEFIEQHFRSEFEAIHSGNRSIEVDEKLLKRYGLTKTDIRNDLEGSWKHFAQSRVRRAGYDMVFRTQFNYNVMNRAVWERGNIRRLLTMYQHYPASFMMGAIKSLRYQGAAFKAGGLKGLFGRSSTDGSHRPQWNNYGAQYMMALGAAIWLTEFLKDRFSADSTFLSLPIVEISKDAHKWSKYHDHEDFSVRDVFWGKGAAQQVVGPAAVDLTNLASIIWINNRLQDGTLPTEAEEILRVTTGVTGHRDVLNEGVGYELSSEDRTFAEDLVEWGKRSSVFNWNAGRKAGMLGQVILGEREANAWDILRMVGVRPRRDKEYEEEAGAVPTPSRGR